MVGSRVIDDSNCHFSVWSPLSKDVSLRIVYPEERIIPMDLDDRGYWQTDTDEVGPGTRYFYRLDGTKDRPDPASKFQPEGVHGSSQVVDHNFNWSDGEWRGRPLEEMVMYELHVGTFTKEGTLEAVIPRLEDLVVVKRHHEEGSAIYAMNFGPEDVEFSLESAGAAWKKALDTSDLAWLGPGSFAPDFIELPEKFHIRPHSLILYLQL